MVFAEIDRLRVESPFRRKPWPIFCHAQNPAQGQCDTKSTFPTALPPVWQSPSRLAAKIFDLGAFTLGGGPDPLGQCVVVRKRGEALRSIAHAGEPIVRPFSDRGIPGVS